MPRFLALFAACCALLAPAAAAQASPAALISDCLTNGRVVGHYSQADYSQALSNLPTDVAEYSDCAGVIRRAQLAAAAAGTGKVTARSATISAPAAALAANPRADPLAAAAPAERTAVDQARQGGARAVDVGGQLVRPGVVVARTSWVLTDLPTPLLIVLGGLGLVGLAVGGRYARDLVRARRAG